MATRQATAVLFIKITAAGNEFVGERPGAYHCGQIAPAQEEAAQALTGYDANTTRR